MVKLWRMGQIKKKKKLSALYMLNNIKELLIFLIIQVI